MSLQTDHAIGRSGREQVCVNIEVLAIHTKDRGKESNVNVSTHPRQGHAAKGWTFLHTRIHGRLSQWTSS